MKTTKVDLLMLAVGVLFALLLVGMMTNLWQLVLYPIPVLAVVLMLVGSLDRGDNMGKAVMPILVFGAPLFLMFVLTGATVFSDGRLFGLQTSLGIVYYFIWPFTTLLTGVLYAFVYEVWLKPDLDRAA